MIEAPEQCEEPVTTNDETPKRRTWRQRLGDNMNSSEAMAQFVESVRREALANAVRAIRADRNESRRGDLAGLNRAIEIVERLAGDGPFTGVVSVPPTPIRDSTDE